VGGRRRTRLRVEAGVGGVGGTRVR